MDPVLGFTIFSAIVRVWAAISYSNATSRFQNAVAAYKSAHARALQEQNDFQVLYGIFSELRQAAMSLHWGPLHNLLVSWGVNGGLFTRARKIFGKRPEREIRKLIAKSKAAITGTRRIKSGWGNKMTGAAFFVRGLEWLDAHHWMHFPFLHENVHHAVGALDLDLTDTAADVIDAFGAFEMVDLFGGGFSVIGLFSAFGKFSAVGAINKRTLRIEKQTAKLEMAWETLKAANDRIRVLTPELQENSYALFKWTVIAEQAARLLRTVPRQRNSRDIPDEILKGLLRVAKRLWETFEKPVFQ